MNVLDLNKASKVCEPSNGKCDIRMFFTILYKEILCWLKLQLHSPSEKGPLYYNYSHFIISIICSITNKWIAVTKINKSVSKEHSLKL